MQACSLTLWRCCLFLPRQQGTVSKCKGTWTVSPHGELWARPLIHFCCFSALGSKISEWCSIVLMISSGVPSSPVISLTKDCWYSLLPALLFIINSLSPPFAVPSHMVGSSYTAAQMLYAQAFLLPAPPRPQLYGGWNTNATSP